MRAAPAIAPPMSTSVSPTSLIFSKMHGLGNDFVVIDTRVRMQTVTSEMARALGDRHRGVGFDQLAVISADPSADLALTFYNADGSIAGACGNATRCIAHEEMAARGVDRLRMRTDRGVLEARDAGDGLTSVNMGAPLTGWRDIPLSHEVDTLRLPIAGEPVATSMGNPHCTYFVNDADAEDLALLGPKVERDPLFPERTNVQVAQVLGPDSLRVRVWERGTGITLASGSSSCAVLVAAVRRGLTGSQARIALDGGTIMIDWRDDGVWMTGPTTHVFTGTVSQCFFEGI